MTCFTLTARAKINGVLNYIEDLVENTGKFIIFGHHGEMLDAVENLMRRLKIKCMRIDGSVSVMRRQENVKQFQEDPETRIAVLSITASGLGFTLTAASTIVFTEMLFTPANLIQAEDRAHRIGQVNPVVCQYLFGENTLDDLLYAKLEKKLSVISDILDGNQNYHGDENEANARYADAISKGVHCMKDDADDCKPETEKIDAKVETDRKNESMPILIPKENTPTLKALLEKQSIQLNIEADIEKAKEMDFTIKKDEYCKDRTNELHSYNEPPLEATSIIDREFLKEHEMEIENEIGEEKMSIEISKENVPDHNPNQEIFKSQNDTRLPRILPPGQNELRTMEPEEAMLMLPSNVSLPKKGATPYYQGQEYCKQSFFFEEHDNANLRQNFFVKLLKKRNKTNDYKEVEDEDDNEKLALEALRGDGIPIAFLKAPEEELDLKAIDDLYKNPEANSDSLPKNQSKKEDTKAISLPVPKRVAFKFAVAPNKEDPLLSRGEFEDEEFNKEFEKLVAKSAAENPKISDSKIENIDELDSILEKLNRETSNEDGVLVSSSKEPINTFGYKATKPRGSKVHNTSKSKLRGLHKAVYEGKGDKENAIVIDFGEEKVQNEESMKSQEDLKSAANQNSDSADTKPKEREWNGLMMRKKVKTK